MNDQIRLGMLPPNYPNQLLSTGTSQTSTHDDTNTWHQPIQKIIDQFPDVFDLSRGLRPMHGPPATIRLRDDIPIHPYHCTDVRKTPLHQQDEANKEIARLTDQGIIAPQTKATPWLLPGFFVGKPDFSLRLVVDAKRLNVYIYRPAHPFNSTDDCLRLIPHDAEILIVFDCKKGYFQIPLDEASQDLLTFLVPQGQFKYLRLPMGCSLSGDEWCARSDRAFTGLPIIKIVDDILIACKSAEAPTIVKAVLERCREHHITLSKGKLQIGTEVKFVGHIIRVTADSGVEIAPHPDRIKAIREFPTPTKLQDLRSFLGLAVQLTRFNPDTQHLASPLATLQKINRHWQWLPEHETAFQKMKKILTSEAVIKPFRKGDTTQLLTDASRLHGMGFLLIQRPLDNPNRIHLIECGSSSLSPAQRNYSTVELEAASLVWAIHKCRWHLLGHPGFEVLTDHRGLVNIFNSRRMQDIDNNRLQRLVESVASYSMEVKWIQGKTNLMSDALSRAPVFNHNPSPADTTINAITSSPALDHLITLAKADGPYQETIAAWRQNTNPKHLPPSHAAKAYAKIWPELSLHLGLLTHNGRAIVPHSARRYILDLLHAAHLGIHGTKRRAKRLYWWPNMDTHIEQMCISCERCEAHQPRQMREPLNFIKATYPFEIASCDLFQFQGRKHAVLKDRYSGFLFVSPPFPNEAPATTIAFVLDCCAVGGYPANIRSDNGPQFRGEFNNWCQSHNIVHSKSDPHRPKGNGNAESGVKIAAALLDKVGKYGTAFKEALIEHNNTPRQDGHAPASMFMGRILRTKLPAFESTYTPIDQAAASAARDARDASTKRTHDKHARDLPPLSVGDDVLIWHEPTETWAIPAKVIEINHPRSYWVATKAGTKYQRNRDQLRPHRSLTSEFPENVDNASKQPPTPYNDTMHEETPSDHSGDTHADPSTPPLLRRSARIASRPSNGPR